MGTEETPALNISPEKVCYIVVKSREFDVKEGPTGFDHASSAIDENALEILADYTDDPTFEELNAFIHTLNWDEMVDVLALVWVGRGDFTAENWAEAVRVAQGVLDKKAASYLTGIPLLSDFLEEGLNQLGHTCEDFEMGHL